MGDSQGPCCTALVSPAVQCPKPCGFPPSEQYLHSDRRMGGPDRKRKRAIDGWIGGWRPPYCSLQRGARGRAQSVHFPSRTNTFPRRKWANRAKWVLMTKIKAVLCHTTDKLPQQRLLLWHCSPLGKLSQQTRWRPTRHWRRAPGLRLNEAFANHRATETNRKLWDQRYEWPLHCCHHKSSSDQRAS